MQEITTTRRPKTVPNVDTRFNIKRLIKLRTVCKIITFISLRAWVMWFGEKSISVILLLLPTNPNMSKDRKLMAADILSYVSFEKEKIKKFGADHDWMIGPAIILDHQRTSNAQRNLSNT